MIIKNKKNILSLFVSGVIVAVLVIPMLVQAQVKNPNPTGVPNQVPKDNSVNIKINNPFKSDTIEGLIETIVNDILIPVGGVVAVVMIIWAGFMYVTAGGDPGKIKKAHDALLWAVIGAAILLGAWVISKAIQTTVSQLGS